MPCQASAEGPAERGSNPQMTHKPSSAHRRTEHGPTEHHHGADQNQNGEGGNGDLPLEISDHRCTSRQRRQGRTRAQSHFAEDNQHAYARSVIRPDGPPWRAALVLALALFGWVAAHRSSAEHPVGRSLPPVASAIESFPSVLGTASDRPLRSFSPRLSEGQRALWITTVSVPGMAPFSVPRSVRSSPSILSAGPIALGLAGRGPPSSTNA